jgi:hypothetical protein
MKSKVCPRGGRWASVLALAALVSAAPAAALFGIPAPRYFYSLSVCPFSPKRWRDPVNVVFYKDATATRTLHYVVPRLTSPDAIGFRPWFEGRFGCGRAQWLRAQIPPVRTRYVLVGRQTFDTNPKWGRTTLAVALRERHVGSCQAVLHPIGYDLGRIWVRMHLGSFGFHSTYWGNTHSFKSLCDGTYSQSNGWVFWFPVR